MTILTPKMEAIVAHLVDKRFVARANTALLLGILWSGLAICVLGALSYDITYWFGAGDRRPLCSFPALSCFGGGAPRPLYRTYEDPQTSLSNSYALTVTLPTG
jgi:hypothetical protein